MNDILLDNDFDLQIVDGDFVIGRSDRQHIEAIVLDHKGEYKEHPLIGFGAINYIKSNVSDVKFKRDLKIQLAFDHFNNAKIDTSQGFENLKIDVKQ